ncbi:MAG TPA: DUF1003 domain-containing protein [Myxococcota bacterium]|nr:DUF1003 domain-containing protein [Myxococcota bacterium]
MHVVIWWLTGIVIGGISHFVGMRRRDGLLGDVSLGIVGGALSGCLSLRLGLAPASPALVHAAVAAGGAVVTIGVTRLLLRLSERESILMPARRHVSSVRTLEAQVSQLGEAECCVLSKLLEHEPIARDYDADFDRQLGVADRLADRVARFGGSWSFIGLSAALLLTWLFYNSATPGPFDPYPFLLLNLLLNCVAALQGPVIMMSQNRLAARDRFAARSDYEVNLKAEMEIMALHAKVDELNQQQRAVLERIERRLAVGAAHA